MFYIDLGKIGYFCKKKDRMDSMKNRRTVRSYASDPIDDALLNTLFQVAARGASTGNMQAYCVVVTRDSDKKNELAPAHFNQKQVLEAPVVLTICVDLNRVSKWCTLRKAQPGFDNVQALTFASIDATIFAQNFCVAAEAHGLGLCYLGTTTYNAGKIIDVLNLPELVLPITTLSVGYPKAVVDTPLSDRLPLDGIVHSETYHSFDSEALEKLYALKEGLEESKKFLEINQKETLAQIYTDIRYKKADNEFFSGAWIEAIKRQGFLK